MAVNHTCPICDQTSSIPWGKKNGFAIFRCNVCGHIYADLGKNIISVGTGDQFREEFTHGQMKSDCEYYDHLCRGEKIGGTTYVTTSHVLELLSGLRNKKLSTLLDIGCGSGYLVKRASESGYTAVGIEPGGWGQLAATDKRIFVKQGYLSDASFDVKFDIITATDVLEHLPDPIEFLRLLSRCINPEGYIVISIPYAESLEAKFLRERWNMVEPPTHSQFFVKSSLLEALNRSGLAIETSLQYNIRNLKGFSRYKLIRKIVDFVIPGPQLVCVLKLKNSTTEHEEV